MKARVAPVRVGEAGGTKGTGATDGVATTDRGVLVKSEANVGTDENAIKFKFKYIHTHTHTHLSFKFDLSFRFLFTPNKSNNKHHNF